MEAGVTILRTSQLTYMTMVGAGEALMTHGFGMVVLVLVGAGTTGVGIVLGVGTQALVGAGEVLAGTTGAGAGIALGDGMLALAGEALAGIIGAEDSMEMDSTEDSTTITMRLIEVEEVTAIIQLQETG